MKHAFVKGPIFLVLSEISSSGLGSGRPCFEPDLCYVPIVSIRQVNILPTLISSAIELELWCVTMQHIE